MENVAGKQTLALQQHFPYKNPNVNFPKIQTVVSTYSFITGGSNLEQGLERYLRYQAPHIRPPIAIPLQYQDPKSCHPFQYETADLPYQAPTYDIKPLELNFIFI